MAVLWICRWPSQTQRVFHTPDSEKASYALARAYRLYAALIEQTRNARDWRVIEQLSIGSVYRERVVW